MLIDTEILKQSNTLILVVTIMFSGDFRQILQVVPLCTMVDE